jgi:hypothetical protein
MNPFPEPTHLTTCLLSDVPLESRMSLPEHFELCRELPSDVVFLLAARIALRFWRQPSVIDEPKFHGDASAWNLRPRIQRPFHDVR